MTNTVLLLVAIFLFTGCNNQAQPRQYTEEVSQSSQSQQTQQASMDQAQDMIATAPRVPSPVKWEMPQGWKQGPDKVMRLVSFYNDGDPDAIDCYIVVLPGMAGGEEANLKRWMEQINLDTSDANYQKLLSTTQSVQTKGGFEAKFYDLDSLQAAPSDKSMIAAIISTSDTTIFVKMTGSSSNLKANQAAFLELLKSLRSNNA